MYLYVKYMIIKGNSDERVMKVLGDCDEIAKRCFQ